MTLPRLYAFAKSWDDTPPLQESVAAIAFGLGALSRRKIAPKEDSPEAQEELAQLISTMPMHARRRPQ